MELQYQFPWVSSLLAHSADFGLASLHNPMNQLLMINLCIHTHTRTHTSYSSVSLENTDYYSTLIQEKKKSQDTVFSYL